MRKKLCFLFVSMAFVFQIQAQLEPHAGKWRTWFITPGKAYHLPQPPSNKEEVSQVISQQQSLDSAGWQPLLHGITNILTSGSVLTKQTVVSKFMSLSLKALLIHVSIRWPQE